MNEVSKSEAIPLYIAALMYSFYNSHCMYIIREDLKREDETNI